MKYVVIVGDGMADYPVAELGGKTPLQAAKTPAMDFIANKGMIGLVKNTPDDLAPASDVANLSLLGYDPHQYYTGRGPLEAANMGVTLGEKDVAFRCNLITAQGDVLVDYSAGHVTTEEAKVLIKMIDKKLGSKDFNFYPGVSYRHLMVWRKGKDKLKCIPPHNITGGSIKKNLPAGEGRKILKEMMEDSYLLLDGHPVNMQRRAQGKQAANMIWLWGQGKKPCMPTFKDKFNLTGSVISAVNLIKGLGKYIGLKPLDVPGITGFIDTNYQGKTDYALQSLKKKDFVFIHVEAPDEAGHMGDVEMKIKAIEDLDALIVGKILEGLKNFKEYKILILPDHFTPVSLKTHSSEPVPFAIYDSRKESKGVAENSKGFQEEVTGEEKVYFEEGWRLMEFFIKGNNV
ncbi:cofactor-independent phosphoglycerate mutase [bacterium]|nr:cofactor-independent phosphoglycerate mutase [bacterium]